VRRSGLVTAVLLAASGLVVPGGAAHARSAAKTEVVASFYPLTFVAQRVGGDRVEVTNLTPAGAEPHDLELSTKQIDNVLDADLVLVLGHNFQPAVEKAAAARDGPTLKLLDRLASANDPHVWLDPVLMRAIVTRVQRALTKADPSGRAVYRRNADVLRGELDAFDARFRTGLAHCARRVFITAHEAFGYLARRYRLRQEGAAGLSPDAEPDARHLAELADLVKREHVTVVFTESLVSPRIADTLAREAGVRTAVLDPLEGLTPAAQKAGATYFTVMGENLRQLRGALACT